MKLEFLTKNYKMSQRLEEVLQRKLSRLDKYLGEEVVAKVMMQDNAKDCKMEISIMWHGRIVRTEANGKTMYYNIDQCLPKLERQIVKINSKLTDKKKGSDGDYMFVSDVDITPVSIAKVKTFDMESMTPQEAVDQLDMIDHDFYMFVNVATGNVEAVYRRKDGNAGHLQPKY